MTGVLEQHVIVYDAKEETAKVFDTAYGEQQIREAVKRCADHHGHKSNPRFVLAKERMRSS